MKFPYFLGKKGQKSFKFSYILVKKEQKVAKLVLNL